MGNANRNTASAGGVFIALGAIGGVLAGRVYGEPTIGLLVGAAVGTAIAVAIWLMDRDA